MTRTIGEAIEGRLHEMKIKPEELATVLDVPLPTLSGWLWLENDIPAQYILKIAHVLRCTPTYLLSGGEEDHEPLTRSDAIEDLIRATVAEVLRQQEAQKRRGDTEPQMRTAAYIERQREQLEQIRAEQAAEHGDPIRAMFRRMGAELLGDTEPDTIYREEDAERMSWSMLATLFAEDDAIMAGRKSGRLAFPPGTRERFAARHKQQCQRPLRAVLVRVSARTAARRPDSSKTESSGASGGRRG